ncbi:hypothetical protein [Candidatus Magnetobacterium casense]|uniref:PqqD family protein n=1 Tax=Candidatus Magnetobacterium casense TaxID=1455061 RepID=A0ABS6S312_9BACT|nr:hypothetical protein [Candidatus Magnetobacterium casensis]MBV6343241.1 hypothetical protein [Candidatus Magnetobacterium casensis]
MKLTDVGSLPDSIIREMIPVAGGYCDVTIDGATVLRLDRKNGISRELYVMTQQENEIFSFFDGCRTIGELSAIVERNDGLDGVEAYSRVKDLFVKLARLLACVPLHAHERPEYEQPDRV